MNSLGEFSITEVEKEIKNRSKPQQLKFLEQTKITYGLLRMSPIHSNNPAFESPNSNFIELVDQIITKINQEKTFKYDCDWNWFYNVANVPNQEFLFEVVDFFETNREGEDALFLLNILFKQLDDLSDYLQNPVDFLKILKKLPLSETQQHILFGLILLWHGGYPIKNDNSKYRTILRLIEKDFLNFFKNTYTPEKEFCRIRDNNISLKTTHSKDYVKKASLINAYPESYYINKVDIYFEDLPQYIIQQGILWRFETVMLKNDSDFLKWRDDYESFLHIVPNNFKKLTIEKGIEYGKLVYEYHLEKECKNKSFCEFHESWEKRLAIAENLLEAISQESTKTKQSKFSTKLDYTTSKLPIPKLTDDERLWMKAVLDRIQRGEKFTFREILSSLHSFLSVNFHPAAMDPKLISSNGEEIRLLGILAFEQNYSLLKEIDLVIFAIKDILLSDPNRRNFEVAEIEEKCDLSPNKISLALKCANEYARFYSGAGFLDQSTTMKSFDIGGDDSTFLQIINFSGIESLVLLTLVNSSTPHVESFSTSEISVINKKLDSILEDLQILKAGQEVIWTDLTTEINELKSQYSLGKKNWKHLLLGKLMDMTVSGVISETLSKSIVDQMKPYVGSLWEDFRKGVFIN